MKVPRPAAFWFSGYLVLVLLPLFALLLAPVPARNGFWWGTGIALGFAGLIMMVMQFALTARLRHATTPFGIDVIYYFHRFLAYALLVVLLAHPLLLLGSHAALAERLNPLTTSWDMLSGMLALCLLVLLIAGSAWRKTLRIPYDQWRILHLLLAISTVALGFAHMWAIGYYSTTTSLHVLWILIAASVVLIQLRVRLIRPWLLNRQPWTVSRVRPENGGAWTLTLHPKGHDGLSFQPGQFAWLSVGHSPFAMREHPFSIASIPDESGSLQFTIKALGDFTSTVGGIEPGTKAHVDGPYGAFSCDRYPDAAGYVFIAGGIGVAPILSMLMALASRGDRRHHVLFTAHSRWDRIPRRDEIEGLAGRLDMTNVTVLEEPPADWQGEKGRLSRQVLERHLPRHYRDLEYFICGPQAMIRAVEQLLADLGVPVRRIHTELFDMA